MEKKTAVWFLLQTKVKQYDTINDVKYENYYN